MPPISILVISLRYKRHKLQTRMMQSVDQKKHKLILSYKLKLKLLDIYPTYTLPQFLSMSEKIVEFTESTLIIYCPSKIA